MHNVNNNPTTTRPEPTAARLELPTADALRAHGIDMTLEEARLVLVVLSWIIAYSKSKSADNVPQMVRGVIECCRIESIRNGDIAPAAHPGLPATGWPAGTTALRKLGFARGDIQAYWSVTRTRWSDACLPLDWVLQFVPAPVWPAVLTMVKWGPVEAALRLQDAVIDLARRPVARATRRRAAGKPISLGTINTWVTGVHQLFAALVDLRTLALADENSGLPAALLEPWTAKPRRPDLDLCGARPAALKTSAPPFKVLQHLLERLDVEVDAAPQRRRYFRLRRRLVAALLILHGPRVEALRAVDVADYIPGFTFSDGLTGPALVYRPGKTRDAEEVHIVALPAELAHWLEDWIAYTGREVGEADSPMWPARQPKTGQPISRINGSAFARMISGHAAPDGTGSWPLVPRGDDPYIGYNPHSFRHAAYQIARKAGALALLESPLTYAHLAPDDFARAVVGHGLIRGTGDFYRDLDQQVLSRIAVEYAWRELRSLPMPHGLDPAAIEEACERIETLGAALDGCRLELHEIEAAQRAAERSLRTLSGDALNAAAIASNTAVFQLAHLQSRLAELNERLADARDDLERALTVEVPLDRHEDPNQFAERLARAQARAAKACNRHDAGDTQITVRQLASVLETTPKTINSWRRNGFPTARPELWRSDAWRTNSEGILVLPIGSLRIEQLTAVQRERLHVLRLGSDAQGGGVERAA
jgi:hypothetical protein